MTYEEFKNLRYRCTQHLKMDDCHVCIYASSDPRISMAIRTECASGDGYADGKATKRFRINGKSVANNKRSIIKAIQEL